MATTERLRDVRQKITTLRIADFEVYYERRELRYNDCALGSLLHDPRRLGDAWEIYYSTDARNQSLRNYKGNPFLNYEDRNTNYAMMMEEIVNLQTGTLTKSTLSQIRNDYMDYLAIKQRRMERGLGEVELEKYYGPDFDEYYTAKL